MIRISVRAVSSEITLRIVLGSTRRSSRPSASNVARTTRGCISTPPFATAPNAAASWSAVTEISCPIDIVGSDSADQRPGSRSSPRLSPANPTPVGAPKPKPVMYR